MHTVSFPELWQACRHCRGTHLTVRSKSLLYHCNPGRLSLRLTQYTPVFFVTAHLKLYDPLISSRCSRKALDFIWYVCLSVCLTGIIRPSLNDTAQIYTNTKNEIPTPTYFLSYYLKYNIYLFRPSNNKKITKNRFIHFLAACNIGGNYLCGTLFFLHRVPYLFNLILQLIIEVNVRRLCLICKHINLLAPPWMVSFIQRQQQLLQLDCAWNHNLCLKSQLRTIISLISYKYSFNYDISTTLRIISIGL